MKHRKVGSPASPVIPGGGVITGSKVKLRQKRLSDAHNDYMWQTDPELALFDAAPPLSFSFTAYLLDYTEQLHLPRPHRLPFAVETLDGRHIGNCTCYDIKAERGEAQLGVMIGDREYRDRGYGTDAVNTLVSHVFLNTKVRRIYLKTLDWNLRAQRCFENCGFTPCGSLRRHGKNFIVMELLRDQWQKRRDGDHLEKDE